MTKSASGSRPKMFLSGLKNEKRDKDKSESTEG